MKRNRKYTDLGHRTAKKRSRRFSLRHWDALNHRLSSLVRVFDSRKEAESVGLYLSRQMPLTGSTYALYNEQEKRIVRLFSPLNEILQKNRYSHSYWKY